ncbi:SDR family NAD(P)-dependent oxidoreductase [Fodinicola feengrottensis]|uniref:SDR family NAD(P)-dependent oxidoreductase n=1 Tax=Fodinicola feengrottensis TaxID=435914 RepID=A0ABN2HXD9_9ACTN
MTSAALRRYDGRTVFIAGAAHGIGRAIAHRLAAEGAALVIADMDSEGADAVVAELAGSEALAVHCDVRDRESVRAGVAAAVDRFGGFGVLVTNAYSASSVPFEDLTDEDWNRDLDPTLNGAVRTIQAAIPHLIASPYGGAVVSIGSVNGLAAFGGLAYSAAKAGLVNVTRNLAVMYGGKGVRFNVVAPGTVRTRVWTDRGPERLAFVEQAKRHYPLGRVGEPEDIAAAVAFLGSDDAAWITGVALPVDGGIMTGPLMQMFGTDPI